MGKTKSNRRKPKNKTMKRIICSPSAKGKDFTCYSDESLVKMKELWNARHPDVRIEATSDRAIWNALRQRMGDVCSSEKCWLRQKFISNKLTAELTSYTFAPDHPDSWKRNPNEWLTSIDIEHVMKQYEKKHKHFEFIGPSPIDFDKHLLYDECVWEELCKFDVRRQLRRGKTKIGIVFNVDPHYMDGSHWISMFIDLQKKYIFFFDSTGDPIPAEIDKLMKRVVGQAASLGIKLKEIVNDKEHQRGDTECGIYSLYLIIELLEGRRTPQYFLTHRVSDKDMEKLRKIYFNTPGED